MTQLIQYINLSALNTNISVLVKMSCLKRSSLILKQSSKTDPTILKYLVRDVILLMFLVGVVSGKSVLPEGSWRSTRN